MKDMVLFWMKGHLRQGRLSFVFLLITGLMALNAYIYTEWLPLDRIEFEKNQIELMETLKNARNSPQDLATARIKVTIPQIMNKYFADNKLETLPSALTMRVYYTGKPHSQVGGYLNFFDFKPLDLTFIVSVIFSFLALALSFNSICGEKEKGTLKLILSNSVSRTQIFISKITATTIVLIVPLLLGFLVNALIFNLSGMITFNLQWIFTTLTFITLSIIFIFIFVTLGVTISAMVRSPVTSLLISLCIWVFAVFLVPGLASVIAKTDAPIDSPEEFQEAWDSCAGDAFAEAFAVGNIRHNNDAVKDDYKEEIPVNRVMEKYTVNLESVLNNYLNKLFKQAELANGLSRISPAMVFKFAAEKIVGTGYEEIKEFISQANRYRKNLFEIMDAAERRDKESPNLTYLGIFFEDKLSAKSEMGELPVFHFIPKGLDSALMDALMDIFILFSFSICILLVGIRSINRYDVR